MATEEEVTIPEALEQLAEHYQYVAVRLKEFSTRGRATPAQFYDLADGLLLTIKSELNIAIQLKQIADKNTSRAI